MTSVLIRNAVVLIEGRNLYAGTKQQTQKNDVDFVGLRGLFVDLLARDGLANLQQITYYTGVDLNNQLAPESGARIEVAVHEARTAGYLVKTFPLKLRATYCPDCGMEGDDIVEKQVDCAMAVDAMTLRYGDLTNIFCLVTSDTDQIPLLHNLREAGKEVWVAGWKREGMSPHVIELADNVIILNDHRERFLREPIKHKRTKHSVQDMLDALADAEKQFSSGYVGLHYFITHWKSDKLPRLVTDRSDMLNELFSDGRAVQYKATDGKVAVRLAR